MPEPVRYVVTIDAPARHSFHVRAEFPHLAGGHHDLRLPVWSPGSYLVREFARNLSGLEARDGHGRRLEARKIDKSTWRIEGARAGLRVDYDVYAFERSVRTNHLSSEHAFLSPAATFLYSDPHRGRPCLLRVEAPRGWKVASALPLRRGVFTARDYDELVDSPIECGHLRELTFEARGTPFRMVICGRGNEDLRRIRRDLIPIAEAAHDVFGYFPFSSYLSILNLTPATRGGLEHRASAALEWPRLRFGAGEQHEDFLALWAHELFHAWNVKEATPRAFRPYDYRRESPTRLLWWFEGVTDYYDELLLRRAGRMSTRRYLDRLVERWERLLAIPGRDRMSVAAASFDAWIKFYRPDENSVNSSVSYYEKGHLLGVLLDLEVREQSGGRRGLDDVVRLVVERGRDGLPEDGVRRALEAITRSDWGRWFERFVDGTDELPLARAWRKIGLELVDRQSAGSQAGSPAGGWLGATLKKSHGQTAVSAVLAGSPAEHAGLSAQDEIVALDGYRVDDAQLRERLGGMRPGARIRLSYFRDDRLRESSVVLGTPPRRLRLVGSARAREESRAAAERWLHSSWEEIAARPAPDPGSGG